VRNLEREIGSVCRHVAVRIAEGSAERMTIAAADLHAVLGAKRFEAEVAMRTDIPASRPAWPGRRSAATSCSSRPRARRAAAADPYRPARRSDEGKRAGRAVAGEGARRRARHRRDGFDKSDIHVHVPPARRRRTGRAPGVAMFVALTSLLTGRPVRADVAMTGEISLRGLVLPIGGVKEKVLAALRAGITTVLLPARNQRDLEDIPADAREQLTIEWLEHIDAAIHLALVPVPVQPAADETPSSYFPAQICRFRGNRQRRQATAANPYGGADPIEVDGASDMSVGR
jgi:ATP-dependent Lon protease